MLAFFLAVLTVLLISGHFVLRRPVRVNASTRFRLFRLTVSLKHRCLCVNVRAHLSHSPVARSDRNPSGESFDIVGVLHGILRKWHSRLRLLPCRVRFRLRLSIETPAADRCGEVDCSLLVGRETATCHVSRLLLPCAGVQLEVRNLQVDLALPPVRTLGRSVDTDVTEYRARVLTRVDSIRVTTEDTEDDVERRSGHVGLHGTSVDMHLSLQAPVNDKTDSFQYLDNNIGNSSSISINGTNKSNRSNRNGSGEEHSENVQLFLQKFRGKFGEISGELSLESLRRISANLPPKHENSANVKTDASAANSWIFRSLLSCARSGALHCETRGISGLHLDDTLVVRWNGTQITTTESKWQCDSAPVHFHTKEAPSLCVHVPSITLLTGSENRAEHVLVQRVEIGAAETLDTAQAFVQIDGLVLHLDERRPTSEFAAMRWTLDNMRAVYAVHHAYKLLKHRVQRRPLHRDATHVEFPAWLRLDAARAEVAFDLTHIATKDVLTHEPVSVALREAALTFTELAFSLEASQASVGVGAGASHRRVLSVSETVFGVDGARRLQASADFAPCELYDVTWTCTDALLSLGEAEDGVPLLGTALDAMLVHWKALKQWRNARSQFRWPASLGGAECERRCDDVDVARFHFEARRQLRVQVRSPEWFRRHRAALTPGEAGGQGASARTAAEPSLMDAIFCNTVVDVDIDRDGFPEGYTVGDLLGFVEQVSPHNYEAFADRSWDTLALRTLGMRCDAARVLCDGFALLRTRACSVTGPLLYTVRAAVGEVQRHVRLRSIGSESRDSGHSGHSESEEFVLHVTPPAVAFGSVRVEVQSPHLAYGALLDDVLQVLGRQATRVLSTPSVDYGDDSAAHSEITWWDKWRTSFHGNIIIDVADSQMSLHATRAAALCVSTERSVLQLAAQRLATRTQEMAVFLRDARLPTPTHAHPHAAHAVDTHTPACECAGEKDEEPAAWQEDLAMHALHAHAAACDGVALGDMCNNGDVLLRAPGAFFRVLAKWHLDDESPHQASRGCELRAKLMLQKRSVSEDVDDSDSDCDNDGIDLESISVSEVSSAPSASSVVNRPLVRLWWGTLPWLIAWSADAFGLSAKTSSLLSVKLLTPDRILRELQLADKLVDRRNYGSVAEVKPNLSDLIRHVQVESSVRAPRVDVFHTHKEKEKDDSSVLLGLRGAGRLLRVDTKLSRSVNSDGAWCMSDTVIEWHDAKASVMKPNSGVFEDIFAADVYAYASPSLQEEPLQHVKQKCAASSLLSPQTRKLKRAFKRLRNRRMSPPVSRGGTSLSLGESSNSAETAPTPVKKQGKLRRWKRRLSRTRLQVPSQLRAAPPVSADGGGGRQSVRADGDDVFVDLEERHLRRQLFLAAFASDGFEQLHGAMAPKRHSQSHLSGHQSGHLGDHQSGHVGDLSGHVGDHVGGHLSDHVGGHVVGANDTVLPPSMDRVASLLLSPLQPRRRSTPPPPPLQLERDRTHRHFVQSMRVTWNAGHLSQWWRVLGNWQWITLLQSAQAAQERRMEILRILRSPLPSVESLPQCVCVPLGTLGQKEDSVRTFLCEMRHVQVSFVTQNSRHGTASRLVLAATAATSEARGYLTSSLRRHARDGLLTAQQQFYKKRLTFRLDGFQAWIAPLPSEDDSRRELWLHDASLRRDNDDVELDADLQRVVRPCELQGAYEYDCALPRPIDEEKCAAATGSSECVQKRGKPLKSPLSLDILEGTETASEPSFPVSSVGSVDLATAALESLRFGGVALPTESVAVTVRGLSGRVTSSQMYALVDVVSDLLLGTLPRERPPVLQRSQSMKKAECIALIDAVLAQRRMHKAVCAQRLSTGQATLDDFSDSAVVRSVRYDLVDSEWRLLGDDGQKPMFSATLDSLEGEHLIAHDGSQRIRVSVGDHRIRELPAFREAFPEVVDPECPDAVDLMYPMHEMGGERAHSVEFRVLLDRPLEQDEKRLRRVALFKQLEVATSPIVLRVHQKHVAFVQRFFLGVEHDDDEGEEETEAETETAKVNFLQYARLGDIDLEVSLRGTLLETRALRLHVKHLTQRRRLWTWNKFWRRYATHCLLGVARQSTSIIGQLRRRKKELASRVNAAVKTMKEGKDRRQEDGEAEEEYDEDATALSTNSSASDLSLLQALELPVSGNITDNDGKDTDSDKRRSFSFRLRRRLSGSSRLRKKSSSQSLF